MGRVQTSLDRLILLIKYFLHQKSKAIPRTWSIAYVYLRLIRLIKGTNTNEADFAVNFGQVFDAVRQYKFDKVSLLVDIHSFDHQRKIKRNIIFVIFFFGHKNLPFSVCTSHAYVWASKIEIEKRRIGEREREKRSAAITQWIRLRLSSCLPRFDSQACNLHFYP